MVLNLQLIFLDYLHTNVFIENKKMKKLSNVTLVKRD